MRAQDLRQSQHDRMLAPLAFAKLRYRLAPPLQTDLTGQGLAEGLGRFGDLIIERIERAEMAANTLWSEDRGSITVIVRFADDIFAEREMIFRHALSEPPIRLRFPTRWAIWQIRKRERR